VTDLALRCVNELHDHYKKELQKKDDNDRLASQWRVEAHQNQIRIAQKETEQYKIQFEQAMSLIETQKLTSWERRQSSMPKRLHRCVAFAVNVRLESITMKIEWLSYSPICRRISTSKSTC